MCEHKWVNPYRQSKVTRMKCSLCGAWKQEDGSISKDEDGTKPYNEEVIFSDEFVNLMTENGIFIESLDNPQSLYEYWEKKRDEAIVPKTEASEATPEYNTDMTEAQAKKTLRTLSQSIINDTTKDDKKKITQYTANIYANVISKNLLPHWAKGYKKIKITLDSYQSFPIFEFVTPTMSQDFVARFINGRETMDGFLHRNQEIKIRMSPRIFHTMKDADDPYNFFKAAVKYYDSQIERVAHRLFGEVMKLGHNMKHLIANSKLSGLVIYPMKLLFVFDNVDISNKDNFKLQEDDIQTVNKFIRNIASRYAAPDKEKKQIIEDVKEMIKEIRENTELDDTMRLLSYLPEAVEQFLFNGFDNLILEGSRIFIDEQINRDFRPPTLELQRIYESFGVKKLKKIPTDLIAYITIETEAIRDANDKMMISSYCLGKLEIVEWYLELLEVGSKKYVVPHTKPYLESIRTQLLACFKKIMDVKIINPNDRPIIDIKYPKGYEG